MLALLPGATGDSVAALCPIGRGRPHPFLPPIAFRIIWPFLYLSVGAALVREPNSVPTLALVVCLVLWPIAHSEECADDEPLADALALGALGLAGFLGWQGRPILRPLAIWLGLAMAPKLADASPFRIPRI